MRAPRSLLLALLAVLALAAAGCGGGGDDTTSSSTATTTATTTTSSGTNEDTSAYKEKVRVIGNTFRDQVARTRAKVSAAKTNPERVRVLGEFRTEFDSLAAKLAAVAPPKRAQAAQDRLVALVRKGAQGITRVQDAIKAGDVKAIKRTSAAFQAQAATIQTALKQLKTAIG